tara:strand:+ start:403 stop:603 length:201 start_codon:yes stop_codon:yes gene_type:complete
MSKTKNSKYKQLKEKADKPTIKSAIEALTIQVKDYTEKEEHFKVLKIKTQGALEILAQLEESNGDS